MNTQPSFLIDVDDQLNFPPREQPANRIREVGPGALSSIELIACILGTKNTTLAQRVIVAFGGDITAFARASYSQLNAIPGIGEATAARLYAALELGRRITAEPSAERYQVTSPSHLANFLMPAMQDLEYESFRVVLMDTRNRIRQAYELYKGSVNTSLVRIAEVFREAIRTNSACIAVAHNHPSGDPTPSAEDIALTRRIVSAGKDMEIEVIDHVIIGRGRWISLRERGLGFEEA
jgi:DNA repair protein RadC